MRIRKSGLSLLLTFALAISTISGWSDVAAEPINNNQIVENENAAKCTNCGSVMKHVEGTEPTCSMFGIKEYWTCSNYDCEEANNIIFFEEECETRCQWGDQKIEMVPHSLVEKTVDKCDGSGTITYYVCYEGCSLEAVFAENDLTSKMNRSELISKLGHQMAAVLELIPTCQHAGMLQHYKCMKCEKHFIDTINFEETTLEEMTLPPLMHIWSNDYYFDDAEHWKQCLYVGCRSEVAAHVYDQNIVNEEWRVADANCVHGTLYYKSCVCGKAGTETFEADAPLSRHDLTTSWVHDENNHWYECEAEGCDYVEAMSEHVYDLIVMEDKYLASDADCQSKAKYYMSCECGAAGTTTVEDQSGKLGNHTPSNTLVRDDLTHYYPCTMVGCDGRVNEEEHIWTDKEIVTQPTTTAPGSKKVECTVCSYVTTKEIPQLEETHVWKDTLSFDENSHWYGCEEENCTAKKDEEGHVYLNETVDEKLLASAATCMAKAKYYKSCDCGAAGTETFESGEVSTTHNVDKEKILKDDTKHWYVCKESGCEYKEGTTEHKFDKEVTSEEFEASKATCVEKAKYYMSCICGKAGTDKFEAGEKSTTHTMGTTYEKDETGHWTKCTVAGCTEKSKVEDHTFKTGETKCNVCGYDKKHTCKLTEVKAVDATCEKAGNIAHYKCEDCAKLYKDKDGKESLKETEIVVEKLEHKNTWYITKIATKEDEGELKGTCSVCGTTTKIDLEKLGTSGKLTVSGDSDNVFDAELGTEDAYMLVELTTKEVEEINKGKDFNILLTVDDLDKDIKSSEKDDMEEIIKEKKLTLIKYLDITLTKQLLDGNTVKESDGVDETADDIEIVFELTKDLINKDNKVTRSYKVLKLHDGKVTVIDAKFDKDDNTVTFETDEFSTYALTYQDKDNSGNVVADVTGSTTSDSTNGATIPDSGDNMNGVLYAVIAGVSMIALVGYFVYNKKKKEK